MNRVARSLVVAALVLAGGGALASYAWSVYQRGESTRRQEDEGGRLFRFGPDEVKSGVIRARGATIAFARTEDGTGWKLTSPIEWPADAEAIKAAVAHMAGVKADTVVSEDAKPEELVEYGLARPALSMEVTLTSGAQHGFLIGIQNAMARERSYITDGSRKRILAAHDVFRWTLDRDLIAFRERRLFPIPPDHIREVRVLRGGAPAWAFVEKEPDRWTLIWGASEEHPADGRATGKLLQLLTRDVKAEAFATDSFDPEDRAARERFGFAPPLFTIEIAGQNGARVRADLGDPGFAPGVAEGDERAGPFLHVHGTRSVAEVYQNLPSDLDVQRELLVEKPAGQK